MAIGGKWVGTGGVLLRSDSSDSEEDDRSGTSDGMRPAGSETEVIKFEGTTGAGTGAGAKACGWSVAPCAAARVELRFLAAQGSLEGV